MKWLEFCRKELYWLTCAHPHKIYLVMLCLQLSTTGQQIYIIKVHPIGLKTFSWLYISQGRVYLAEVLLCILMTDKSQRHSFTNIWRDQMRWWSLMSLQIRTDKIISSTLKRERSSLAAKSVKFEKDEDNQTIRWKHQLMFG